jgi:hypothetical protein
VSAQVSRPPAVADGGGRAVRAVRRAGSLFATRADAAALLGGGVLVGLMLVWAVHDGGYDQDTWYWGALVALGTFAATVALRGVRGLVPSRPAAFALLAMALYTAWSYLSMLWAQDPGLALDGSNRALLYLLITATMTVLPWTARAARCLLIVFALAVGTIAVVLLFRLASTDRVATLIIAGRLAAPIGYFNGAAALFEMQTLISISLASRRELPGLLRGLLTTLAAACLTLCVIVQSRGWLFTLPLVAIIYIALHRDRLRLAAAAVLPAIAVLIPIHRLLAIYDQSHSVSLGPTAARATRETLLLLLGTFVIATIAAWVEGLPRRRRLRAPARRLLGAAVSALVVAGAVTASLAVSRGDPIGFISREWSGFSHEQTTATGSHFSDVGTGRYDFWRVALHAFEAHPIGGLGQDNFRNYYLPRRRTFEEPAWTHSLELRLLAHTGAVGFLLFFGALIAGAGALRPIRARPPSVAAVIPAALSPLIVWLLYGSVDWFWEIPALSGPALGFLGMAMGLARREPPADLARAAAPRRDRVHAAGWLWRRWVPAGLLAIFTVAATTVLAFCYLSVREDSLGTDLGPTQPTRALADLAQAASLNPLNLDPVRVAGTIALRIGHDRTAAARFGQALQRDPGDWFSWLGAGLAASALGHARSAERDFRIALSINDQQPAVSAAAARALGPHPLSALQAFRMLIITS